MGSAGSQLLKIDPDGVVQESRSNSSKLSRPGKDDFKKGYLHALKSEKMLASKPRIVNPNQG